MNRFIYFWRSILVAALLGVAVALAPGGAGAAPEGSRFNAEYFTNLPVVTHNGEEVPFYDGLIKGKMVVINFAFLSCNDICPLATSRVAEVRRRLGDRVGRDVFIYTITTDPEHDTPELLKEHAEAFGAGTGWTFITGKPENIREIRWRLGERSRTLSEHRNDLVLGADLQGEWSRSSAFADIEAIVSSVNELDPRWRAQTRQVKQGASDLKSLPLGGQPGMALFAKACSTCHTIGRGDLIGPDLKDVTARRQHDWLVDFIKAPNRMLAMKDAVALDLAHKYKGVRMPNLGLQDVDVCDLLEYIEALSARRNAEAAAGGASKTAQASR